MQTEFFSSYGTAQMDMFIVFLHYFPGTTWIPFKKTPYIWQTPLMAKYMSENTFIDI